jgi:hypothetical protein
MYGFGRYWNSLEWQSGNGRDVIGLDGCVLVWQSRMKRAQTDKVVSG